MINTERLNKAIDIYEKLEEEDPVKFNEKASIIAQSVGLSLKELNKARLMRVLFRLTNAHKM